MTNWWRSTEKCGCAELGNGLRLLGKLARWETVREFVLDRVWQAVELSWELLFPLLSYAGCVCNLELGNTINNLYTKVTYFTFIFRLLHYHPPHLDIVPWTLNENFSAIQELTQFCTTGFCSYLVRLLAENCVYATFQVRSVNQLDRGEHCSYSRTLTKLISCTSEKK